MIVGIAYHSPLDVMALFPLEVEVSIDPTANADILISEDVVATYNARVQLVFASSRVLLKNNLPILDQGPWGKILTLTGCQFDKLLGKDCSNGKFGTPEWVRV